MMLSVNSGNYDRARKAYAILVRCREVKWAKLWRLGMFLLSKCGDERRDVEYLRAMLLQHPDEAEAIMQELVLTLTANDRERDAMDELELYLPSFPYHDNAALHLYAGMISLHLAQGEHTIDKAKIRSAQGYLERAKQLQPEGEIAQAWLDKSAELLESADNRDTGTHVDTDEDDEDVDGDVSSTGRRASKRVRS
ncbi:unnamed protein product [Peniophora sp. CBMAI 1063]|nr:unnamed protein product [Peniophora sp. CBMAI 1063]